MGCHYRQSVSDYLAKCNPSVQPVHEVIHIDSQLGIQSVHPFGQVFAHSVQVLLARLEWPIGPRFQKYGIHTDKVIVVDSAKGFLEDVDFSRLMKSLREGVTYVQNATMFS